MHEGFVLLLKCPFGQFVLWIFNFNGALYIVLSVLLYSRSKFLLWVLVNLIRILVPYWFFGGLVQKLTIEVWKKKNRMIENSILAIILYVSPNCQNWKSIALGKKKILVCVARQQRFHIYYLMYILNFFNQFQHWPIEIKLQAPISLSDVDDDHRSYIKCNAQVMF